MATDAQIQAIRDHAQKSCGPKTDEGKARSRLNALKHGLHARAGVPVLPHEDPAEFDARVQEWLDDHQPTNPVERELVVRAARLSWTLDRAERYEAALLSGQVRKAMLGAKAERLERVCEWGRKLFYNTGPRLPHLPGPDWTDDPSAFVARLEGTAEGARWLLARWLEVRFLLLSGRSWTIHDQFRYVRLLGKQPVDAVDDPQLNAIFLAWETIHEGWGSEFWARAQSESPKHDPAFNGSRTWREIVPRPESEEAAITILVATAQRAIERLEDLIVDLDEIEGDDALELAEQASFCASVAGERLRRFQSARTRELLRTIELLAKLRKIETPKKAKTAPKEPNPPAPEPPPPPSSPISDGPRPIAPLVVVEARGPVGSSSSSADRVGIRVKDRRRNRANEANGPGTQIVARTPFEHRGPAPPGRERTESRAG